MVKALHLHNRGRQVSIPVSGHPNTGVCSYCQDTNHHVYTNITGVLARERVALHLLSPVLVRWYHEDPG
jgi:hypothetical protein